MQYGWNGNVSRLSSVHTALHRIGATFPSASTLVQLVDSRFSSQTLHMILYTFLRSMSGSSAATGSYGRKIRRREQSEERKGRRYQGGE